MNKNIVKQNGIGVIQDNHFSPRNYIQLTYGEVCNSLDFKDDFVKEVVGLFDDWEIVSEDLRAKKGEKTVRYKTFIKETDEGCIIVELEGNFVIDMAKPLVGQLVTIGNLTETELDTVDISIFYTKSETNAVFELTNKINEFIVDNEDEECSPIYLIVHTRSGFDLEEFDIKNPKIDLELNYGKEFLDVSEKIKTELSKKKNQGLVLLHGEPGTGKTTYIKWLVSQLGKDKKVVFVPPYLTESITSPEFVPFLASIPDSILVIEDAERVVSDRTSGAGSSIGVSNILNMTDGILGDIMSIQIICSFNMSRSKIDPALLRKGRLIAEHKFDSLDKDASNKLIEHLGIDFKTDKPMTLAQIYNINEEEFLTKENIKIGF
jgi:hypothetical protein